MTKEFLQHLVVAAAVWAVLTEADAASWVVGVPAVLAAAACGAWLTIPSPTAVSVTGWLRFIPRFWGYAVAGGFDVAWRAFRPEMGLAPGLFEFPTRLPPGTARVFFMNTISLLPGTLSADVYGDTIRVHAVDTRQPNEEQLVRLEGLIAQLFSVELTGPERKAA
jgi:multicomponent Na+:H+ antiporter subunit E